MQIQEKGRRSGVPFPVSETIQQTSVVLKSASA